MLEPLRARGPDGEGIEQDGPLTVGHRRLAVLDLSAAARQPMRSAGGRYLVSYNGEIYNFADLRQTLGLAANELRTKSDTEILLCAWERWGPAALERFVGQWAFSLYDAQERRLWLVRDRFGEKPLFYHHDADSLSFASTIRALTRAPWIPRELDASLLREYVRLRYVVAPRTVLRDVWKLPPGHLLSAGPDGISVSRWWAPRFRYNGKRLTPLERCDLIDEFGSRLDQAAQRCLVSDVPVALLLSHGLDSDSIRATLAASGRSVTSFTYRLAPPGRGAPADGFDVRPAGAGAFDIHVGVAERFRHLAPVLASLTEPVGDGSILSNWILVRAARPLATVFLSGNGGDEILGGYRVDLDRFRLAAMRRASWMPAPLLRMALAISGREYWKDLAALRGEIRGSPPQRIPAVTRYLVGRPLPGEEADRLLGPSPNGHDELDVIDRLYDECAGERGDVDCIQAVMFRTFLSENILSFSDSVAMDSSAEIRLPYLDRDLVDLVLRLPPDLRVKDWPGGGSTKVILRHWYRRLVPSEAGDPRKRTFNYGSIRHLLTERRKEFLDLVLGSAALRRALPGLEAWVGQPASFFHGPAEASLWAIVALGVWCEAGNVT